MKFILIAITMVTILWAQDDGLLEIRNLSATYEKQRDRISIEFDLTNLSPNDSLVISSDPWIAEYAVTIDGRIEFFTPVERMMREDRYPAIGVRVESGGSHLDTRRDYAFDSFRSFLFIPPDGSIQCMANIPTENAIADFSLYRYYCYVRIAYTSIDCFRRYVLPTQTVTQVASVLIDLSKGGEYQQVNISQFSTIVRYADVFRNEVEKRTNVTVKGEN
jgi:hypothetical protein